MNGFDVDEGGPLECSPETPWGLHPAVTENVCPRCGWIARGDPGGAEAASAGI
jgi:hypothetical protein